MNGYQYFSGEPLVNVGSEFINGIVYLKAESIG